MDFRTLEILVWLVKDPNLVRTSERLKLSQPTLTKRLSQLEDELGFKLFERRGALGMVALPAALSLAETAKKLLDTWNYSANLNRLKEEQTLYLSLTGPSLFMQLVVGPYLASSMYSKKYRLHLHSSSVMDINYNLSGDKLDGGFVFDSSQALDFHFLPVGVERLAVILNRKSNLTLKDIQKKSKDGLRWLTYRPDRDPLSSVVRSDLLPAKTIEGYFEDITGLLHIIRCHENFATVLPMHSVLFDPENLRGIPLEGTENSLTFVYRPHEAKREDLRAIGEGLQRVVKESTIFY